MESCYNKTNHLSCIFTSLNGQNFGDIAALWQEVTPRQVLSISPVRADFMFDACGSSCVAYSIQMHISAVHYHPYTADAVVGLGHRLNVEQHFNPFLTFERSPFHTQRVLSVK